LAALPLLVAACGVHSKVTPDQACSDRAKAECAKLDQCRKNGVVDAYGDLGTCIQRVHDNCLVSLMAPGNTGGSPDVVESCAQALPAEACQDYLQSNPVAACQATHGAFAMGAACTYNSQCQTGFCAVPKGMMCGTCKSLPMPGDPCTETGCGQDLACTPMEVCEPWVAAGGACDNKTMVCAPGQTCVIPAGMTAGTCQADAEMLGGACDYKRQTGPACDANAGLYCNVTNQCVAIKYGPAGSVCGTPDKGMSDNVCTKAAGCYATGAGMPAMCMALGIEGASCDTAAGPGCVSPARCIVSGGTSGTCMVPDPTMCM
jgi:hypothetical protein